MGAESAVGTHASALTVEHHKIETHIGYYVTNARSIKANKKQNEIQ
jgi:hypothetical protein